MFKTHLCDANGLRPFGGLCFNLLDELCGRSKNTTSKNYFFWIKNTDEVRCGHSPIRNTFLNNDASHRILLLECIKYMTRCDLVSWIDSKNRTCGISGQHVPRDFWNPWPRGIKLKTA